MKYINFKNNLIFLYLIRCKFLNFWIEPPRLKIITQIAFPIPQIKNLNIYTPLLLGNI